LLGFKYSKSTKMYKDKFIGMILLLLSVTSFAQDKEIPTPQWRPAYHFSPPRNWTNDPNGLIYLDNTFHLYYQHNPVENKWGHMSWGHAASKDLITWNHLPVAIPEIISKDTTTLIFSGSAVLDRYNTSGLGKNGKAPVVAIFTSDQPKQHKQSQYIAYSNDGGLSYTQFPGNPVIDLNKKDFRDPNVFWYEPAKQWIMAVAMVDERMVRFYGSKNLKEWTKLSDFGPAGYTKNGWECPSLLPLAVDGNPLHIKWVLFVSLFGDHGPEMQYFIGDFNGVTFTNDNSRDKILKVDYGDAFYAAIAWRDAPQDKKILLGWLINGRKETYPWKGQMSIPRDLSIKTTPDGLRLIQKPSSVVNSSLSKYAKGRVLTKANLTINGSLPLSKKDLFTGNSNWINAEFKLGDSKKFGFVVAEQKERSGGIIIGYDADKQELYVDCTATEKSNKDVMNLVQTAPLKPVDGLVSIQVLLDRSSLEVFGNGGERVISTMVYPDHDATGISVFSKGKTVMSNLKIWNLSN
jgi:fructan beta-fructosidase